MNFVQRVCLSRNTKMKARLIGYAIGAVIVAGLFSMWSCAGHAVVDYCAKDPNSRACAYQ